MSDVCPERSTVKYEESLTSERSWHFRAKKRDEVLEKSREVQRKQVQ